MLNRLKGVFKSFQDHDVRYLVIGGIASILHGVPRATFDLDILIDATPDNARRLLDALKDAGMGTASLTDIGGILAHEITVFSDRLRLDVMTRTPGLDFAAAWQRRKTLRYEDQDFCVLSKEDLIASKRASGRKIDLEDVRLLDLSDDVDGSR